MADKQDSNFTGLSVAEEATLGVLPGVGGADAVWHRVEPNSYSDFGGDFPTIARDPINPSRQRQKGTIVDLDASGGFNHDFVMTGMARLLQSFFFAAARQKPDTKSLNGAPVVITAVTDGGATDVYAAAAGLGGFIVNHLLLASGFTNALNNGVKVVDSSTATEVGVVSDLEPEVAPPAAARLQVIGYEFPAADVTLAVAANGVRLASAAIDVTTLNLTPGEWVYVGGDLAANQFVSAANRGFARVGSVDADGITFDQTGFVAVNDAGTAKSVRIFFGTVIRNEKVRALITRRTLQLERTLGDDADGEMAEYVKGAVANELTLNIPLTDKLNVDMSYVGIDVEHRDGLEGIKAGTRVEPTRETAVNTSTDIVRNHLAIHDPDAINSPALVGYITDGNISINNGVTPNKAVGRLGAFDTSAGNFVVDASLTGYFSTVEAIRAIRANADVGYNVIAAKDNTGFCFDIPLLTLGGGRLNVEKDTPIMIPLENAAGECDKGYTMLYCQFPYLPTVAMPV